MSSKLSPQKNLSKEPLKRPVFAKKSLGQNFLEDKNIVNKIIASTWANQNDVILEIGPGLGALTIPLAYHCHKIIAVEKDEQLADELKTSLKKLSINNVEIIEADILKELAKGKTSQIVKKLGNHYQVVANIPYYLTSPLIRQLLESANQPEGITLMIQKEVAQRICSQPPRMSLLSTAVQYYSDPKVLFYVSKNSFWPKPKIDSAVIRIEPKRKHSKDAIKFFKVIKAGFSSPRKQILNNLSVGLNKNKEKIKENILESKLKPTQRAETLTVGDWERLTSIILPNKKTRN
ncbi:MAG: 16S rRNA (adenine(1518)-N(6)/adenine(1519)-N(6))-dimethyltransferase RsmA [Candidatus Paceibacterota bacterium]|jgi:16S rRNA (adenine1518-N6/adenine1519-N6)-dimethyltransferase